MFCRSSFVLLAIVLSVLLRNMDSDYPFGIFKLFLIRPTWMEWLYKVRLMRNDMNCLLFWILFQRFFLNRNSCFVFGICCDCLCICPVFFSVLFCILLLSYFVWWVLRCLTGLSFSWLFGFHTLLSLSSHRFLYAILPQHYRILRCNAVQ